MKPDVTPIFFNNLVLPPFTLVAFVDYPAGVAGVYHEHDCFQFVLVLSGEFFFEQPDDKLHLLPGEAGIIFPGTKHSWRASQTKECKAFSFSFEPLITDLYGDISVPFGSVHPGWQKAVINKKEGRRIVEKTRAECHAPCPGSKGLIKGYLLELVSLAARSIIRRDGIINENRENRVIRLALNYIEAHYRRPITLTELAQNSFLGPSRFSEKFRKSTGSSPMRYVHEFRLNKAKRLIRYSDMTAGEIAAYLGFESIHYFSRAFKKHFGYTLSEFKTRDES